MTLVYREERKSVFDSARQGVGPGAYFTDGKPKKPQPKTPATDIGFLSRTEQQSLLLSHTNYPGPGHYTSGASELIRKYDAKSSIFLSKVTRFDNQRHEVGKENSLQGGDLGLRLVTSSQSSVTSTLATSKEISRRLHPQRSKATVKANSIPSIPCRQESYGYRTDEKGELQPNKSPAQMVGKKDRSVGPGSYNVLRQQISIADGCGWSNSKVKREVFKAEPLLKKHTFLRGCTEEVEAAKGCYLSKISREPGVDGSHRFELLKESMRRKFGDYYEQNIRKLQPILLKISKSKQNLGPGAYIKTESTDYEKGEKQQCFLSKQPRFVAVQQSEPLPVPPKTEPTAPVKCQWKGPFMGTLGRAHRFAYPRQNSPGPGTYQPLPLESSNLVNSSFGRELRFTGTDTTRSPGPADYQLIPPASNKRVVKYDSGGHTCLFRDDHPTDQSRLLTQQAPLEETMCSRIPFGSNIERSCIYPVEKQQAKNELPTKRFRCQRQLQGHLYKSIRKSHGETSDGQLPPNSPGPGSYQLASSLERSTFNITADKLQG